ncbi:MAG: serine kinase [Rhodobacterales bacterium]|jgi:HPr kinase/phosphorylase|nr:serine kinase [Rhodobacterales bacterium]
MDALNLHSTTVSLAGRAVLITGASGTGKSALGLTLLAWGCDLVADDRTEVVRDGAMLLARCPAAIGGLIEARGVGLLRARSVPEARIVLAVDMDVTETERMPPLRHRRWLDCDIPLLHKVESRYFAAAILQYLKAGERLP